MSKSLETRYKHFSGKKKRENKRVGEGVKVGREKGKSEEKNWKVLVKW